MLRRILQKLNLLRWLGTVHSYRRFLRHQPSFNKHHRDSVEAIRAKLLPTWEKYVRDISAPNMAASLELGILLYSLCKANQYKRVVDLGSGFSSYVFRTYAKETPGVDVYSIDDDLEWLEKTRQFLSSNNLGTNLLMSMEEFLASGISDFDIILHDLNFVEERIKYTNRILPLIRPGGLIVWDDVHKPDYALALLQGVPRKDGELFSLRPVTLDQFGRYSLAYLRWK